MQCALRHRYRMLALALLAVLAMALCFSPTDDWVWDPSFYYAHIRSPLLDNDLDFRNETRVRRLDLGYTATGLQDSPWPIGPSLLWSPFFLAAHGLTLALSPAQADGFAVPYIALVAVGSLAYGIAGLGIIYRLCRAFEGPGVSLAVTALCLVATPLFFYTFRQPLMAHTTGLLAAAAMLLIYLKLSAEVALSRRSGLLFGVALALCCLTRWSGLLMAFVPAVYFGRHLALAVARPSPRAVGAVLGQVAIMAALFLLTLTPQLALWYRLHGSAIVLPQSRAAFVDGWLPLQLPQIFFATSRGLLFWCPFVLAGMVGIALIPDRRLRLIAGLITLGQVVVIGYRVDWYGGGGFGARYFVELLPFLAIGVVCLVGRLPRGGAWRAAAALCGVSLALHQLVLMHAYEHIWEGWIDAASYLRGQPLGLGWQREALDRLLHQPELWLAPRPYVGADRQTILVNLVAGRRDPRAYLLTGLALALAPVLVLLAPLLRRAGATRLLLATAAYFAAWTAFLIAVG